MDSLCCVHAGELALPSKQTGAGEPSQRSDAEGRDGHIKRGRVKVADRVILWGLFYPTKKSFYISTSFILIQ